MKVGGRYRSKNTTVEIIVVKGPKQEIAFTCAGEEMVGREAGPRSTAGENPPDTAAEDLLVLGKRYVDSDSGLEVLCTTAGAGPVCVDGRRMAMAEAKLLPSSD